MKQVTPQFRKFDILRQLKKAWAEKPLDRTRIATLQKELKEAELEYLYPLSSTTTKHNGKKIYMSSFNGTYTK